MVTYYGSCPNAKESLILFEAVKRGLIPTVSDRLSEQERKEIVSGAIYIWDEKQSPMRRWTDGRTWSNSRVVGDFLEYRESMPDPSSGKSGRYCIKPYGLRKRSICLPAHGDSSLRLIAYFNSSDLKRGALRQPSADPLFADIVKKLESNPSEQQNLQLLASMRRTRRYKNILAKPVRAERTERGERSERSYRRPSHSSMEEVATITNPPTLPPLATLTESYPWPPHGPSPVGVNYYTPYVPLSERFPDRPTPPITQQEAVVPGELPLSLDKTSKKALVLPSPVLRTLNLHSEDRRALDLLNSRPPPLQRNDDSSVDSQIS